MNSLDDFRFTLNILKGLRIMTFLQESALKIADKLASVNIHNLQRHCLACWYNNYPCSSY